MKLLVCGGRDYSISATVDKALDTVAAKHNVTLVIHGAAQGADSLAEQWAAAREIPYAGVPAPWSKRGNAAGPQRNQRMLDEWEPDAVVAFGGGRGTQDMVDRASKAGVPVWEIDR